MSKSNGSFTGKAIYFSAAFLLAATLGCGDKPKAENKPGAPASGSVTPETSSDQPAGPSTGEMSSADAPSGAPASATETTSDTAPPADAGAATGAPSDPLDTSDTGPKVKTGEIPDPVNLDD